MIDTLIFWNPSQSKLNQEFPIIEDIRKILIAFTINPIKVNFPTLILTTIVYLFILCQFWHDSNLLLCDLDDFLMIFIEFFN